MKMRFWLPKIVKTVKGNQNLLQISARSNISFYAHHRKCELPEPETIRQAQAIVFGTHESLE